MRARLRNAAWVLGGLLLSEDVAVKFFRLGEALYYKMLEAIVEREKVILGEADLSVSTPHMHHAAKHTPT